MAIFIPGSKAGGAGALDDLTDVEVDGSPAPENNQVLTYDETQSPPKWIANDNISFYAEPIVDGMSIEKQFITVVNEGGTLYAEVTEVDGGLMHYRIAGNDVVLDTVTGPGTNGAARVELTPGSDANNPIVNYLGVLDENEDGVGVLAMDNNFPLSSRELTSAFAWVGKVLVPDAATFDITGPYAIQRFTEAYGHNGRGALSYQREKLRVLGAVYGNGGGHSLVIDTGQSPDSVHFPVSSATIYQLHRQIFPAFSTGPYFLGNGDNIYETVADLNEIITDANGNPMEGNYYNLVFWGAVNETDADCKLFVNIPIESYKNKSQAVADINNTADFTVPHDMRTVGFLIGRAVLRYRATGGGTFEDHGVFSLLGIPLGIRTGGAAAAANNEFSDVLFHISDDLDETKKIQFLADNITPGETRVITMPDKDITLISEAPEDGTPYSRQDAGWVASPSSLDDLEDVDTSGSPGPQHGDLLSYDTTLSPPQWIPTENNAMVWNSGYTSRNTDITKNTVVVDDGWLMIANTDTSDKAAPQPAGNVQWAGYGDSPSWQTNSSTASAIYRGQRYTALNKAVILDSIRIWIDEVGEDYVYETWFIKDPLGIASARQISSISAPENIGWVPVSSSQEIIALGAAFDVFVIKKNLSSSTSFAYDWNYITPQNATVPATGEITHANKLQDELRIHVNDSGGTDRGTNLDAVKSGDEIRAMGLVWNVQTSTDNGTYYTFVVDPLFQGSAGLETFTFTIYGALTANYAYIPNHYQPFPTVEGLYSDTDYASIITNNDGYGVDVEAQDVIISPDWDVMAHP
jgi:hypothetical protein